MSVAFCCVKHCGNIVIFCETNIVFASIPLQIINICCIIFILALCGVLCMKDSLTEIEQKIGYIFNDKQLLLQAFTHSSFANTEHVGDNERMEFFGDAILEFLSTEYLYRRYGSHNEGELSAMRAKLVSAETLAAAVDKMDLARYLRVAAAESQAAISRKTKANLFEAMLCAVYLDGGTECARVFFERSLGEFVPLSESALRKDAKTRLQEYCQKRKLSLEYKLLGRDGPDNQPSFRCGLYVENKYLVSGEGSTKKEAEQDAANKIVTEWRID